MSRYLILLVALVCSLNLDAQQSLKKTKLKWKVGATNAFVGAMYEGSEGNANTFEGLLKDNSGFTPANFGAYGAGCSPYCSLFNLKYPMTFGFGLSLHPYRSALGELSPEDRLQELRLAFVVTLRSTVDGYKLETASGLNDTLSFEALQYRMLQVEAGVQADYLFNTNFSKFFTLFAGVGARIGMPMSSRVDKVYTQGQAQVVDSEAGRYLINSTETYTKFKLKPSLHTRMYIPLGMKLTITPNSKLIIEGNVGFSWRQSFGGGSRFNGLFGANIGMVTIW